jgi:predicted metalloprotease
MKTDGRRESSNIEDRRGQSAGGRRFPGGGMGAGGGLGLVVIVVLALFFGIDPRQVIDPSALEAPTAETPADQATPLQETAREAERRKLIGVVLAETEDAWHAIFAANGARYEEPTLVLFRDQVQSACGFAQSASGPFYCPADRKLFLDLAFFDDMSTKLRQQGSQAQANALSVKLELQADCLAGIWANKAQRQSQLLEAGDIEEALNAAAAVGDDRLQKRGQGYVVPESFTHGTSAERVEWFKRGLQTGDLGSCDTFAGGI